MFLHLDCVEYRGDRPCRFARLCEGCPHYTPMGPRVLIIKLGALGDVVRTGCLLPGLAAQPEPPWITWITSAAARPLVERMPGVHRVLTFDHGSVLRLLTERFDTVICLDKDPEPCALAMQVAAERKLGIGLSRYGTPFPLNDECRYYFLLGLDDDEKFRRNQKTYPQLIYEALGMPYDGQRYTLRTTAEDRAAADARLAALTPGVRRWVGLHPGAGAAFAHKAWRDDGYVELIRTLAPAWPEVGWLLLGGPGEEGLVGRIAAAARPLPVFIAGTDHPLGTYAALIERCDVVVAGDTLAMHLAVALQRRVVAIFGPTCPQEIDLFGRGVKIVSPIGCAPCYRRVCDIEPHCMDLVSVPAVAEALESQLAAAGAARA